MLADEARRFAVDGYVVQSGAMTPPACDQINEHVSGLIRRAAERCRAGGRVPSFWETMRASRRALEVFWDVSSGGLLDRPADDWERSVMRLGHGLHEHDPIFARACSEVVGARLRALARRPLLLLQSALTYKPARSSAVQFGMHQDSAYLLTEPESLMLGFLALDEMTVENGCLEVIPGSHAGAVDTVLSLGEEGFAPLGESRPPPRLPSRPLVMSKGDLAILHGRLYHASGPNRSTGPRRALLTHVMSEGSQLAPSSWLHERTAPAFSKL